MGKFDITLNKAAALRIPFKWRLADGSLYDLSGKTVTLKVAGSFSLAPEVDPAEPMGRVLHFTKEHAAALDFSPQDYHVVMTTNGEDQLLWEGRISAKGFA